MRKRILSGLLALCLLLALLPMTATAAGNREVILDLTKGDFYIYSDGYVLSTYHSGNTQGSSTFYPCNSDSVNYVLCSSEPDAAYSALFYPGVHTDTAEMTASSTPVAYHAVMRNLDAAADWGSTICVTENVTLNLVLEGENVIAPETPLAGIYVAASAALNLSGEGRLNVSGGAAGQPAIGASVPYFTGDISITGGLIFASATGAPAIGGDYYSMEETADGELLSTGKISISGSKTTVIALSLHYTRPPVWRSSSNESQPSVHSPESYACAIGSSMYSPGSSVISITDGARVSTLGAIGDSYDTVRLDDTISLWAQCYYNDWSSALAYDTSYVSDEIYLYLYEGEAHPLALDAETPAVRQYTAQKTLNTNGGAMRCTWTLDGTTLFIDGTEMRTGIEPAGEDEKLGSWALLNGKQVDEPTPPEETYDELLGLIPLLDDMPFTDVTTRDWFYDAVKSAWENGLIDGAAVNRYLPNDTLSVAQAIKLAAVLHQKQNLGRIQLANGSVHWYDSYVSYAVENGLIERAYQSRSEAQMNAAVTRAEFVHILFKTLTGETELTAAKTIPDVAAGSAYADEICAFYRAGILTGSDKSGAFYPNSTLKRSEAAAILNRLFDAKARVN